MEHVEVLMRYIEPLLLARFNSIFPELANEASDDIRRQALLARYASNRKHTRFRFFADRVWQSLFDRPGVRKIVGPKMFHEFLRNRASLKLGSVM